MAPKGWLSGFLSPQGEYVPMEGGSHISTIIANPERFGFTKEHIEETYEKYGENMGREGKAREELIVDATKNGWMRVAHNAVNDRFTINVWELNGKAKSNLKRFAEKLSRGKLDNQKHQYSEVFIHVLSTNEGKRTDVAGLMSGYVAKWKDIKMRRLSMRDGYGEI